MAYGSLRGFTFEFFDLEDNIRRLQSFEKGLNTLREPQASSEEILLGKIINFHCEKGYGFIQCASRPNNVFFHIRNDVDENVVARIEAVAEETTGWRQLDVPVAFREKWIGKARGYKPAAFDIKLYLPDATEQALSQ